MAKVISSTSSYGPKQRFSNSKISDSEVSRTMRVADTMGRAGLQVDDNKTMTQLAREQRRMDPVYRDSLDPLSKSNNTGKRQPKTK